MQKKVILMQVEKECLICGKKFLSHLKSKKYCSAECSEEADRRRHKKYLVGEKVYKKICANCGKEFETAKSTKVYCSIECKRAENQKAERAAVAVKKCVICGKEFETNKPTLILTCSKECSKARHLQISNKHKVKKSGIKICPICKQNFEAYRATQKYCSEKCRDAARSKRKNETLKTARLEYKFKDEGYVEIHRDIFRRLLRQIFNRE